MLSGLTISWIQSPLPQNVSEAVGKGEVVFASNSAIWTENLNPSDVRFEEIGRILMNWANQIAIQYGCEPAVLEKNTELVYKQGKTERFHNQVNSFSIKIALKKKEPNV